MAAKFEIIDFPETTLVGLDVDFYGGMSPKYNAQEVLGPVWATLFQKIEELGLPMGTMIGVNRNAESFEEGLLNQFAGLVVEHVPSELNGLSVFQIPAMKLAMLEHHGVMDNVVESVHRLYSELIPNSGYQQPQPWRLEIEIYDERFSQSGKDSIMLIGSPVI